MQKIAFLFKNVWKQIKYNKFISTIMLITMMIGFFFPLMAVNDVNDLLADSRIKANMEASKIAVIDYIMGYKDKDVICGVIENGIKSGLFHKAGFCALEQQILYAKGESYAGGVCGISNDYLELNACELLSGDLFSQDDYMGNGEKVCLLGHQSILVKNGVKTGDDIEILGEAYKVKGIVRAPRIYGGLLLPYAMSPELFSSRNSRIQYQFMAYSNNEEINPRMISFKLFPGEDRISIQTALEQEETYYKSIRKVNSYRIFRSSLIIVFAVINFFLLLTGKILRERQFLAVRMAVGASRGKVIAETITGNLCLMFTAFLIDVLIYRGIAELINVGNIFLQPVTVMQVSIGGLLLVSLTSYISYYISFQKQEIAQLLKKQA